MISKSSSIFTVPIKIYFYIQCKYVKLYCYIHVYILVIYVVLPYTYIYIYKYIKRLWWVWLLTNLNSTVYHGAGSRAPRYHTIQHEPIISCEISIICKILLICWIPINPIVVGYTSQVDPHYYRSNTPLYIFIYIHVHTLQMHHHQFEIQIC